MDQAIKHHDIRFLHRCLIHLHVVLNAEGFILHIFVILPIAQFQISTQIERHYPFHLHHMLTRAHTCRPLRYSERLVNVISGWCDLIQNLYHDAWEESSDHSDRNIDQRLED